MNDFTASNGMQIRTHPSIDEAFGIFDSNGNSTLNNSYDHLNLGEMQALREFFQAEADERYGKWRSRFHPDCFAVWAYVGETIHVCSDKYPAAGSAKWNFDRESSLDGDTIEHEVAREFFDAHPEPKPWKQAGAGEVWLLTIDREADVPAVASSSEGGHVVFTAATGGAGGTEEIPPETVYITAGRRIWPEVSS